MTSETKNNKNNLRKIYLVVIPLLILLVLVLFFMNHLTDKEKSAYDTIVRYQKMLKDPQSMTLYGDVITIASLKTTDESYHIYTYFGVSSNNEFGSQIKHIAMFEDYRYVGYFDKAPVSEMSDEEFLDYLSCQTPLLGYRVKGEEIVNNENCFSVTVVNSRKIARKLHCKYMDDE